MCKFLKLHLLVWVVLLSSQLNFTNAQEPAQQRPRRVTSVDQSPQNGPTAAKIEEVTDGDVVRVDTQLVSVPAVVTNSSGRPIANLRSENFKLFENGLPQKITEFATTETPFEIALLLDTSGSTRNDVALIRQAAASFIEALRPGDRVAIISFNGRRPTRAGGTAVEVLTRLTDNRRLLRDAIESVGTSNGTPLYDALQRIAEDVFSQPPSEEMLGRRAVVALTDGVDSTSETEFENARQKLLRTGVASYFIQVNTEEYVENGLLKPCGDGGVMLSVKQIERYRRLFRPKVNREDLNDFCEMGQFERMQISRDLYNLARKEMNDLARASGGKNFTAATLQDARSAFSLVAAEIGTQYSLGYYPTNKSRDGKFRTIKVQVEGVKDKAQVRAREGYYAPKS